MSKFMVRAAAVLFLLTAAAFGQSRGRFSAVPLFVPADQLPEFDVADIQPSRDGGQPRAQFLPGGRIQFSSVPLKFMILAAWGWEDNEARVTGGPSWINSDPFHIVAKAPPDSTIDQLRLMLRNLLIRRFGLESHIEDKVLPVYALTRGKGEPKLARSAGLGKAACPASVENNILTANCQNITMDELATALRGIAPAYIDRPVVNLTGLNGLFEFKLSWTARDALLGTNGAHPDSSTVPAVSEPTAGGRTIFESVEKNLGLRLEATKHAIPVLAVDKIQRTPTEK